MVDKNNTSWEEVAVWYDSHLRNEADSYQTKVILPRLLKLLKLKPADTLADIACGSGFFAHALAPFCGKVVAVDASPSLLELAKKNVKENEASKFEFICSESLKLEKIISASVDVAIVILALQNIREMPETLLECARILKPNGKLHIVLNHPYYRIPKHSEWRYDEVRKVMSREVDKYMTEFSATIVMNPSKHEAITTTSFHRPLSSFIKAARDSDLVLANLEEWVSHKTSQPGPRAEAENKAREEFPLFMYLEFKK